MRRRLIQLGLFIFAGAIVNVAVAWGWVAWRPAAKGVSLVELRWPREEIEVWQKHALSHWPKPAIVRRNDLGYEYGEEPGAVLLAYERVFPGTNFVADDSTLVMAVVWEDYGWPMLSLRSLEWREGFGAWNSSVVRRTYLPIKRSFDSIRPEGRLPLRPIWPGFAINTVFYAGILWGGWLLFAAPFALRRWWGRRRIKRDLCPACAYPVGDSAVCTECGSPLPLKGEGRVRVDTT